MRSALVSIVGVVAGCAGDAATPVDAEVTTPDGALDAADVPDTGWDTAGMIEADDLGDARYPQIAIDPDGNALAVWEQADGTRTSIWANRYVVDVGWGTAVLIESDDAGNAMFPRVAIDSGGDALAVWEQSDGIRSSIWSNHFLFDSGWGTPVLLEADDVGDAGSAQIVIDSSGGAAATWHQSDGTRRNIWVNRFTPSSGWETAALIATGAADTSFPQIAADGSGNLFAVWLQSEIDGGLWAVWARRFSPASGWESAAVLDPATVHTNQHAQIAVEASGSAFAVWNRYGGDAARVAVWADRFDLASGWGTPTQIENGLPTMKGFNIDSVVPQIVVDGAGIATAVMQQGGAGNAKMYANRFVPGTGWGFEVLISNGWSFDPQLDVDVAGTVTVVWKQFGGTHYDIWSRRFVVGEGWVTPTRIESNDGHTESPQVAVNSSGRAIAVWSQTDGTRYNVWSNTFSL